MLNNKVIFDRNTGTTVTIASEAEAAIESFARAIQSAYATHNTGVSYDDAEKTLAHSPLPDEWLLVALDTQRSIQNRAGFDCNLQEKRENMRITRPESGYVAGVGASR